VFVKKTLLLFGVSALVALACSRNYSTRPGDRTLRARGTAIPAEDPIATVGHGAIIDANGKTIDPTPEFVLAAQRYYIDRLSKEGGPQVQAELDAQRQRLRGLRQSSVEEQVVVSSVLIDWLIDRVRPEDLAQLASKNGALRNVVLRRPEARPRISPDVLKLLDRERPPVLSLTTTNRGAAYIDECRSNGVPIPPDWSAPGWSFRGALPWTFIVPGPIAEVFTFESQSPDGICLALPRSTGDNISALGIICLGRQSGKVCFWDNFTPATGVFPIKKGAPVPLSSFGGGADLLGGNGVCTDCHAGQNPYIVHPGTPLDIGPSITGPRWYEPIVHASWPQNPGPTDLLEGIPLGMGEQSCLTCHSQTTTPLRRFPEVSTQLTGYCASVLTNAVMPPVPVGTMPPGAVGSPAYETHRKALLDACRRPPRRVIVNGGPNPTTPTPGRKDKGGKVGVCPPGTPDCPYGFCYWRAVRGPFWQTTGSGTPPEDKDYRGSFLHIHADGGQWAWRAFKDSGATPVAEPGGVLECTIYPSIRSVPDPNNCFANQFSIIDPRGMIMEENVDATVVPASANPLTGFFGNVAQTNVTQTEPDTLRVFEQAGRVLLRQSHNVTPPPPLAIGPLKGETWINGCAGWTPDYAARDVSTTSDVQLVPAADAGGVFCYITGITGAWSSTRAGGMEQPFAEIYNGPGGDIRLRVSPSSGEDRIGARASCVRK
jgi:hypothetical protein